ncbi:MAG: protein kinase [Deltaproteobacteria bacterium]|nr:protein kinase [Deltaproteobacteria bacterium]
MTNPAAQDPLIGRRFGSYVVQRKLGEGGMGAVYELVHPQIGKRQALKVLHAEFAKKQSIVQRFFDEARAVVTIGHPNIVDITDYATLEDDTAYIVMEFLEGSSLAAYAKQRGPMSPLELAEIALPICDALAAAHAHGIVHRDLKPENVHLVPRPDNPRYVKVLDFGIAKLSGDANVAAATKTGQVMGTPMYMSPEQAMGRTKEIDHRTDIYALGIIIYQLFAGELPFMADSFGDLMLMHLTQPPPPLAVRRPDLPPAWGQIIERALAKNRDDRFASMAEFAAAIRAALGGQTLARPMTPAPGYAAAPGYPSQPGYASQPGYGSQPPQTAYQSQPPYGSQPPGSQPQGFPSQPHALAAGSTAPASHPSWPADAMATPTPTKAPGGSRSRAPWIIGGALGVGAAVAAVVVLAGGKKPAPSPAEVASATIDAGAGGTSGAVAAVTPPDAAAVAVVAPPDAAVAVDAGAPDAAEVAAATPEPVKKPVEKKPVEKKPIERKPPKHPEPCASKDPCGPGGPTNPKPPIDPAEGEGTIKISAVPWANINVNGRDMGQTPVTMTVRAGQRIRIIASNPDLAQKRVDTVMLEAGQVRAVRFTFADPSATPGSY